MDDKATLSKLFPNLSEEALDTLYNNARIETYPPGTVLCREGEFEDIAYILLHGQVDVCKHLEGELYVIDTLTSGFFGEIAMLLERPRSSDVVVSEEVKVMEISREDFMSYMATNPEFVIETSRVVLQRTLAQVDSLTFQLASRRKKDNQPPPIFISYSRQDLPFVKKLTTDLKRQRFNTWLDIHQIDPGLSWSRQVGAALDHCKLMLLILSPSSLESENVDDEWNYYLDNKKPVIPVLYQPCQMPFRLHKLQYINFANQDYGLALNRLVATLYNYEVE